jgi:hypothetical protein
MANDNPAPEEDWSIDDLDGLDEDPSVTSEEKKLDEVIANQGKVIRKVAEKVAQQERQAEIDKLTGDFYAAADETEKELAEVVLPGLDDPQKIKKAIDLVKAKAAKMRPQGEDEGSESSEDESDDEHALSPPVSSSPPRVKNPLADLAEKTRRGDNKAALQEFMHYGGGLPKKR